MPNTLSPSDYWKAVNENGGVSGVSMDAVLANADAREGNMSASDVSNSDNWSYHMFGKTNTDETNALNLLLSRETNELNYKMNQENNETQIFLNQQNNALQKLLADESYQRSTASNQIAELMAAGFSEQQARQIVGGAAPGASMPMPTTTAASTTAATAVAPEMQVGDKSQIASQMATLGVGSATTLLGQLAQDMSSADGGAFGQAAIGDLADRVAGLTRMGIQIPESAWLSPEDFDKWARSAKFAHDDVALDINQRTAINDLLHSSQYMRSSHGLGRKAFGAFLSDHRGYMSYAQNYKYQQNVIEGQRLQNAIQSIKIEQEDLDYLFSLMSFDEFKALQPYRMQYDLDNFIAGLARLSYDINYEYSEEGKRIMWQQFKNDAKNSDFITLMTKLEASEMNAQHSNVMSEILAQQDKNDLYWNWRENHPTTAKFLSVFDAIKRFSTIPGEVASGTASAALRVAEIALKKKL